MSFLVSAIKPYLSSGYDQVSTRVVNLCSAGWETYKTATFVIQAPIDAAFDLATFGSDVTHSYRSIFTVTDLSYRIAVTYENWLKVLNPEAKIKEADMDGQEKDEKWTENHPIANGRIVISNTPILLRTFAIRQQDLIEYFNHYNSSHWFNQQITTRLIAPVSALAALVVGAVVTTMGVIAALLSFVTCGWSEQCNSFAWDNLRAPAWMLNQVHQGLMGIIRPDLV